MKKGIFSAMMFGFALAAIHICFILATECKADGYGYGSYTGSSTQVGQQNTGYSAAAGGNYSARTYYEPYYYWYCGKRYVGYKAVVVPAQAPTVNNPVGAVNTDNSISYHYEYNINYSQLPQNQGTTLYGYPNPLSADTYQNTDLAVLDQYVRLQSDAQTFLNEGHARTSARMQELTALAQIQASGHAASAETLAKGLAAAEVNRSSATLAHALSATGSGTKVQSNVSVRQGSGKTEVVSGPGPGPGASPPANGNGRDLAAQVMGVFQNKCVMCHGERKKGNLDLRDLSALSPQQVDKVLARVIDTDPLRRMPLQENGDPGQPLSVDEVRVLMLAAGPVDPGPGAAMWDASSGRGNGNGVPPPPPAP